MSKANYRVKTCRICLGQFPVLISNKGSRGDHCQRKLGRPGEDCWFEKGSLHQQVANALLKYKPKTLELAELRERLLRNLISSIELSELAVDSYLTGLSDDDRAYLLRYTASQDELYLWLQKKFHDLELISQYSLLSVSYPELPDSLLALLKEWENLNRRRLLRRIKNGFDRSPRALIRLLSEAVRLAMILHENGKVSWSQMTLADQLDFAKKNNIENA